jgi:hypothetical protein
MDANILFLIFFFTKNIKKNDFTKKKEFNWNNFIKFGEEKINILIKISRIK